MAKGKGKTLTREERATRVYTWGCLCLVAFALASCIGLPFFFPVKLW